MVSKFTSSHLFWVLRAFLVLLTVLAFRTKPKKEERENLKIELGRQLFFDKALSQPNGQSCTVCHAPKTAFADPNHAIVSEGMVEGTFVNRNAQSLAYAGYIPPLHRDSLGNYRGGLFWDGRSNSLEHQLAGPFFNKAEMNNEDTVALVDEVLNAEYYPLYKKLYGRMRNANEAYINLCEALAAFERGPVFHEFTSKFDYHREGKATFTEQEKKGLELFQGKGQCAQCHSMSASAVDGKILFTDYGYYNLGIPKNPSNPFYTTTKDINPHGTEAVDYGLGGVTGEVSDHGKFRVPTLRNVQYTGPYFHNGYFATLKEVVHFINRRDAERNTEAEIKENVAYQITGSLHLSDTEEDALVAFLLCLTDGYVAP